MAKESVQAQVLRASKEIAVKFIEVGRLSPTNFGETFKTIYRAIDETVREREESAPAEPGRDAPKSKSK